VTPSRRLALVLVGLACAGCGREHAKPGAEETVLAKTPAINPPDSSAPTPSAVNTPEPLDAAFTDAASATAGEPPDPSALYSHARVLGGKSIGHTSVVFKLSLEGGVSAAYKPRSTRGDARYRGEIAAYRLARALSLGNVPPAYPRAFPYADLRLALGRETVFPEVVKEPNEEVRGAILPWIKGLEFIPLESDEWMGRWRGWLRSGGALPDDQRALAAQISTLLALDVVIGNWDRWSGGNIGIDRARGELLYVDNDGAFFDPVPRKEFAWPTTLFEGVDRFSRSFVTALRALDVRAAAGEETPGEPLLSARVLEQTEARRKRVIGVIDAKIKRFGEKAVLFFN
jgi:hypothetical protein